MTIAILTDADDIRVGTEMVLDTTTTPHTYQLMVAGNIGATTRVSLKAIYQCHKSYWLNTDGQLRWPFPWKMITSEIGICRNGWEPYDNATRKRHALGGWKEVTTIDYVDIDTKQEWCSVLAGYPSDIGDTEQCYYEQITGIPVDFTFTGAPAEPIQIFGDSTHGNFDRTGNNIIIRARTPQRTPSENNIFSVYNTVALNGQLYRIALSTTVDAKASVADTGIDANSDGYADVSPYDSMTLTGYTTPQSFAMQGGSYDFSYVIDANTARLQRVYEWDEWIHRKNADVDSGAGTLNGKCSPTALYYVDKLYTRQLASGKGVYIYDMDPVDQNACSFTDDLGVLRTFKYVAVATILPSVYAQSDVSAKYEVHSRALWGTSASDPLLDASGVAMAGSVSGRASIPVTWDWSENGDLDAIVIISGFATSQWEIGLFRFTQSTEVTVQVAAAEEIVI
jgi:hypothetical protein